ncbi:MAG: hypothetical protein WC728_07325 [Elusimicrobiota bacterium]
MTSLRRLLASSVGLRQLHASIACCILLLSWTRAVLPLAAVHAAWSLWLRWRSRRSRPTPYEALGPAGGRRFASAAMPVTGALAGVLLLYGDHRIWWAGFAALMVHLSHGVPSALHAFGWRGEAR